MKNKITNHFNFAEAMINGKLQSGLYDNDNNVFLYYNDQSDINTRQRIKNADLLPGFRLLNDEE